MPSPTIMTITSSEALSEPDSDGERSQHSSHRALSICGSMEYSVRIVLRTDASQNQSKRWHIRNTVTQEIVQNPDGSTMAHNNSLYEYEFCLASTYCYDITVQDVQGKGFIDGGFFKVIVENTVLHEVRGNFGYYENYRFNCESTSSPSPVPPDGTGGHNMILYLVTICAIVAFLIIFFIWNVLRRPKLNDSDDNSHGFPFDNGDDLDEHSYSNDSDDGGITMVDWMIENHHLATNDDNVLDEHNDATKEEQDREEKRSCIEQQLIICRVVSSIPEDSTTPSCADPTILTRSTSQSIHLIDESKEICDICLAEYEVGDEVAFSANEKCTHGFHTECIGYWLLQNDSCPVCRQNYINI